jgi:hypothetical protein
MTQILRFILLILSMLTLTTDGFLRELSGPWVLFARIGQDVVLPAVCSALLLPIMHISTSNRYPSELTKNEH